ncbi:MAG: hypothetical protein KDC44_20830, partial [Phaeodactylibacter sp.]|nr:hypothetical protein [Phaeodactylibacter sp.]
MYETLQQSRPQDLIDFQQRYVRQRNYTLLVLGDKSRIDLDFLHSFGPLRELSIQEVFGYH